MLTCKEFLAELNEFLDANENIDLELRRKLESHINECPNCWVVCDTTKKTIQVYKGMTAQVLPPAVQDRLLKALERKLAAKKAAKAAADKETDQPGGSRPTQAL